MRRSKCEVSIQKSEIRIPIRDRGRHEKILVVQTSFLGDAVLTTPLFSEIRVLFPESQLSVLCTPQAKGLLEGNPDLNEIITYDKKGEGRGWLGLWNKAKDIRGRGFTIAISPHKSFRSGLLLFLARIPFRVGFRRSAGWYFYHCRVNRDATRHDVERNLSILGAFGVELSKCRRDLRVEAPPHAQESVERIFSELGIQHGMTIGLNPGSVWATKRWTAEGYAELIVQLKEKYCCQILLFGGPEDGNIVDKIQELSGNVGISLTGKIKLSELSSAIDWCDLFITNDSGPMHVAVARGVPVVAIFCATIPSLGFYPYSSRAVIVEKNLPCRPCGSHGGRRCPLGTEDCMRLIKAKDVLRGVERLLNGNKKVQAASPDVNLNQPELITL